MLSSLRYTRVLFLFLFLEIAIVFHTATKFYAIVTFGRSPAAPIIYRSLDRAVSAAQSHWDTSSCSTVRVYECDTRELAKTADVSQVRTGEHIVWSR